MEISYEKHDRKSMRRSFVEVSTNNSKIFLCPGNYVHEIRKKCQSMTKNCLHFFRVLLFALIMKLPYNPLYIELQYKMPT